MNLIEVKIITNEYVHSIKNQAELEECFKSDDCLKTIFLNPDKIQYKTDLKECKEYYSPYRTLGKYFIIHCDNGEDYYLHESEFNKI